VKLRSWLPLLLALLLALPGAARAERPVEDDVRELLKLTGVEQQLRELGTQMRAQMSVVAPQVPAALWDELFSETSVAQLVDRMVPVYVEELSPEDIRALVAFYRSPAGQRFAQKLPVLQKRGFEIGQQWGAEIGMRVALGLGQEEGKRP
jgi:hypothetical protein